MIIELIEERRLIALCDGQCYQKHIERAYDKNAKPRSFREGDVVLDKIMPFKDDAEAWLSSNKKKINGSIKGESIVKIDKQYIVHILLK